MNCLWCDEEIMNNTTWENMLFPDEREPLCQGCSADLEMLAGNRCSLCSRQTDESICSDCKWWKKRQEDQLVLNHSLFSYNELMQDMVARWKYRGDYILGNAFKAPFIKVFKKEFSSLKDYEIIPVPLSEQRLKERGFNQAGMLADFITEAPLHALTRVHGEKQAKKSRFERLSAPNPFEAKEKLNKPAILVDDIYTTGITLRHAAETLTQAGCPAVYSLTLIRG